MDRCGLTQPTPALAFSAPFKKSNARWVGDPHACSCVQCPTLHVYGAHALHQLDETRTRGSSPHVYVCPAHSATTTSNP